MASGRRARRACRRNREYVLAKKLARYTVNGRKRSLPDVAAELESQGYVTDGKRYGATAVTRMIAT